MKIVLLDPGLQRTHGHHLDIDIRLSRALIALGHEVEIATYRVLTEGCERGLATHGFRVRKLFRAWPYKGPPRFKAPPSVALKEAQDTAEDLAHAPPADLWFWPSFTPIQLLACVLTRPQARVGGGLWYEPALLFENAPECWTTSAKLALKHNRRVVVGSYDDTIRCKYQLISGGLDIVRFPAPFDGAPRRRSCQRPRRIGLLGYHRPDRGLSLLPSLIEGLLARGFEITLQNSSGDDVGNGMTHPRLRRLGYVDDFTAELDACDLILWPSKAEKYRDKTSGITCESLASGVPIVMPSGCIPADLVAPTGAGIFFDEFSDASILDAVDRAAAAYPVIAAAAWRASLSWREREGTMRLARMIAAI